MFGMMGANAQKEIGSIRTAGAFTTIVDVSADPEHGTTSGGRAKGLWIDSPLQPYRSGGVVHFLTGAQDTYRYAVPDNIWTQANIIRQPSGPVRQSVNNHVYQDYDHRIWPFGVWANSGNVWAIGHHEWYGSVVTDDGIPGYAANPGHEWVSTPLWMKSTSHGGAGSWSTKAYTTYPGSPPGRERLFLQPKSWVGNSYDTYYGFTRGTNIVYENGWYYSLCPIIEITDDANNIVDMGFCMFRWDDLEDPTSTEFWNGSGWTARSLASWQGMGGQTIYSFFKLTGIYPYAAHNRNDTLAQSIRYHEPTGQWLLFGYRTPGNFSYVRTKTLANPRWEQNGATSISLAGGGVANDYVGFGYMTVFDPSQTDQNFLNIGNSPYVVVGEDHVRYKMQPLTINVV